MKATVTLFGVLAAVNDDLVLVELTLLYRNVNLYDILPNNAPGTDVKMPRSKELSLVHGTQTIDPHIPDLRVAHESIAKTDCNAMRLNGTMAVVFRDRVHVSGVCGIDSITLHPLLWCNTPSVVNAVACGITCQ